MKLEDAMADAILRRVLECPEKFPENLQAAAKKHWETWEDRWEEKHSVFGKTRYETGTFHYFLEVLSASVQDLPE
jgi:hypothetical protein